MVHLEVTREILLTVRCQPHESTPTEVCLTLYLLGLAEGYLTVVYIIMGRSALPLAWFLFSHCNQQRLSKPLQSPGLLLQIWLLCPQPLAWKELSEASQLQIEPAELEFTFWGVSTCLECFNLDWGFSKCASKLQGNFAIKSRTEASRRPCEAPPFPVPLLPFPPFLPPIFPLSQWLLETRSF